MAEIIFQPCDEAFSCAIQPGDLLVTASTPGRAMKASPLVIDGVEFYPSGVILGKALEGESGVIDVLVTLQ